ncbi:mucin-2-like [Solea solea]|uniref:mucin-2-like n=1 Tax=Solea solea TaxID=90069 RepID=UPI00272A7F2D|nr:mucin-2-like [Solea solea]
MGKDDVKTDISRDHPFLSDIFHRVTRDVSDLTREVHHWDEEERAASVDEQEKETLGPVTIQKVDDYLDKFFSRRAAFTEEDFQITRDAKKPERTLKKDMGLTQHKSTFAEVLKAVQFFLSGKSDVNDCSRPPESETVADTEVSETKPAFSKYGDNDLMSDINLDHPVTGVFSQVTKDVNHLVQKVHRWDKEECAMSEDQEEKSMLGPTTIQKVDDYLDKFFARRTAFAQEDAWKPKKEMSLSQQKSAFTEVVKAVKKFLPDKLDFEEPETRPSSRKSTGSEESPTKDPQPDISPVTVDEGLSAAAEVKEEGAESGSETSSAKSEKIVDFEVLVPAEDEMETCRISSADDADEDVSKSPSPAPEEITDDTQHGVSPATLDGDASVAAEDEMETSTLAVETSSQTLEICSISSAELDEEVSEIDSKKTASPVSPTTTEASTLEVEDGSQTFEETCRVSPSSSESGKEEKLITFAQTLLDEFIRADPDAQTSPPDVAKICSEVLRDSGGICAGLEVSQDDKLTASINLPRITVTIEVSEVVSTCSETTCNIQLHSPVVSEDTIDVVPESRPSSSHLAESQGTRKPPPPTAEAVHDELDAVTSEVADSSITAIEDICTSSSAMSEEGRGEGVPEMRSQGISTIPSPVSPLSTAVAVADKTQPGITVESTYKVCTEAFEETCSFSPAESDECRDEKAAETRPFLSDSIGPKDGRKTASPACLIPHTGAVSDGTQLGICLDTLDKFQSVTVRVEVETFTSDETVGSSEIFEQTRILSSVVSDKIMGLVDNEVPRAAAENEMEMSGLAVERVSQTFEETGRVSPALSESGNDENLLNFAQTLLDEFLRADPDAKSSPPDVAKMCSGVLKDTGSISPPLEDTDTRPSSSHYSGSQDDTHPASTALLTPTTATPLFTLTLEMSEIAEKIAENFKDTHKVSPSVSEDAIDFEDTGRLSCTHSTESQSTRKEPPPTPATEFDEVDAFTQVDSCTEAFEKICTLSPPVLEDGRDDNVPKTRPSSPYVESQDSILTTEVVTDDNLSGITPTILDEEDTFTPEMADRCTEAFEETSISYPGVSEDRDNVPETRPVIDETLSIVDEEAFEDTCTLSGSDDGAVPESRPPSSHFTRSEESRTPSPVSTIPTITEVTDDTQCGATSPILHEITEVGHSVAGAFDETCTVSPPCPVSPIPTTTEVLDETLPAYITQAILDEVYAVTQVEDGVTEAFEETCKISPPESEDDKDEVFPTTLDAVPSAENEMETSTRVDNEVEISQTLEETCRLSPAVSESATDDNLLTFAQTLLDEFVKADPDITKPPPDVAKICSEALKDTSSIPPAFKASAPKPLSSHDLEAHDFKHTVSPSTSTTATLSDDTRPRICVSLEMSTTFEVAADTCSASPTVSEDTRDFEVQEHRLSFSHLRELEGTKETPPHTTNMVTPEVADTCKEACEICILSPAVSEDGRDEDVIETHSPVSPVPVTAVITDDTLPDISPAVLDQVLSTTIQHGVDMFTTEVADGCSKAFVSAEAMDEDLLKTRPSSSCFISPISQIPTTTEVTDDTQPCITSILDEIDTFTTVNAEDSFTEAFENASPGMSEDSRGEVSETGPYTSCFIRSDEGRLTASPVSTSSTATEIADDTQTGITPYILDERDRVTSKVEDSCTKEFEETSGVSPAELDNGEDEEISEARPSSVSALPTATEVTDDTQPAMTPSILVEVEIVSPTVKDVCTMAFGETSGEDEVSQTGPSSSLLTILEETPSPESVIPTTTEITDDTGITSPILDGVDMFILEVAEALDKTCTIVPVMSEDSRDEAPETRPSSSQPFSVYPIPTTTVVTEDTQPVIPRGVLEEADTLTPRVEDICTESFEGTNISPAEREVSPTPSTETIPDKTRHGISPSAAAEEEIETSTLEAENISQTFDHTCGVSQAPSESGKENLLSFAQTLLDEFIRADPNASTPPPDLAKICSDALKDTVSIPHGLKASVSGPSSSHYTGSQDVKYTATPVSSTPITAMLSDTQIRVCLTVPPDVSEDTSNIGVVDNRLSFSYSTEATAATSSTTAAVDTFTLEVVDGCTEVFETAPSPVLHIPATVEITDNIPSGITPAILEGVLSTSTQDEVDTFIPDVEFSCTKAFEDTCSIAPAVSEEGKDEGVEIITGLQDSMSTSSPVSAIPTTDGTVPVITQAILDEVDTFTPRVSDSSIEAFKDTSPAVSDDSRDEVFQKRPSSSRTTPSPVSLIPTTAAVTDDAQTGTTPSILDEVTPVMAGSCTEAFEETFTHSQAVSEDGRDKDGLMTQISSCSLGLQDSRTTPSPTALLTTTTEVTDDTQPGITPGILDEVDTFIPMVADSSIEAFKDTCSISPTASDDGRDENKALSSGTTTPSMVSSIPTTAAITDVIQPGTTVNLNELDMVSLDVAGSCAEAFEEACSVSQVESGESGDKAPQTRSSFNLSIRLQDNRTTPSPVSPKPPTAKVIEINLPCIAPAIMDEVNTFTPIKEDSCTMAFQETCSISPAELDEVSETRPFSSHSVQSEGSTKTASPVSPIPITEAVLDVVEMFTPEVADHGSEAYEDTCTLSKAVSEDSRKGVPETRQVSSHSVSIQDSRKTPSTVSPIPMAEAVTDDTLPGITSVLGEKDMLTAEVAESCAGAFEETFSISPAESEDGENEITDTIPSSSHTIRSQDSRTTPSPVSPLPNDAAVTDDTLPGITSVLDEMDMVTAEVAESCAGAFETFSISPAESEDGENEVTDTIPSSSHTIRSQDSRTTPSPVSPLPYAAAVTDDMLHGVTPAVLDGVLKTPAETEVDMLTYVVAETCTKVFENFILSQAEPEVQDDGIVKDTMPISTLTTRLQDSRTTSSPVTTIPTTAEVSDDNLSGITFAILEGVLSAHPQTDVDLCTPEVEESCLEAFEEICSPSVSEDEGDEVSERTPSFSISGALQKRDTSPDFLVPTTLGKTDDKLACIIPVTRSSSTVSPLNLTPTQMEASLCSFSQAILNGLLKTLADNDMTFTPETVVADSCSHTLSRIMTQMNQDKLRTGGKTKGTCYSHSSHETPSITPELQKREKSSVWRKVFGFGQSYKIHPLTQEDSKEYSRSPLVTSSTTEDLFLSEDETQEFPKKKTSVWRKAFGLGRSSKIHPLQHEDLKEYSFSLETPSTIEDQFLPEDELHELQKKKKTSVWRKVFGLRRSNKIHSLPHEELKESESESCIFLKEKEDKPKSKQNCCLQLLCRCCCPSENSS